MQIHIIFSIIYTQIFSGLLHIFCFCLLREIFHLLLIKIHDFFLLLITLNHFQFPCLSWLFCPLKCHSNWFLGGYINQAELNRANRCGPDNFDRNYGERYSFSWGLWNTKIHTRSYWQLSDHCEDLAYPNFPEQRISEVERKRKY